MPKGMMGSDQLSVVSSKSRCFNVITKMTSIRIFMASLSFGLKHRKLPKLSLPASEKELQGKLDQIQNDTAC